MDGSVRAWKADPHRWAATYRPKQVDAALWDGELGGFVRGLLGELVDQEIGSLPLVARALSLLGAWAYQRGTPLDRELVLDPVTVEQFCATLDESRAGTYRSALRRVGRLVTRKAPWDDAPDPRNQRTAAPPYTSAELARLEAEAANQATALRRRVLEALLALGVGVGLDGRWLGQVRGTHVTRSETGALLVAVPAPAARLVAVRDCYADRLERLAAQAGDELVIGGQPAKNRVSTVKGRLVLSDGAPPVDPGRLRATWLVAHLQAGTNAALLADAAGLEGLTSLSDLLAFVARPERGEALAALRKV